MTYSTAISSEGSESGVRPKKSMSTFNRSASLPISRLIAFSSSLEVGAFAKVAVATAYRPTWLMAAECVYENPRKFPSSWLAMLPAVMGSLVKISRNISSVTPRGMLEILKARDSQALFDRIDEYFFLSDSHSHANRMAAMPARRRTGSDGMRSIIVII